MTLSENFKKIILEIEREINTIEWADATIQSVLWSLEVNKEIKGDDKNWMVNDLRQNLNKKEKALATLNYLKQEKLQKEMKRLKMEGTPDEYLEVLEKTKKRAGVYNLWQQKKDKEALRDIKKNPHKIIKLKTDDVFERKNTQMYNKINYKDLNPKQQENYNFHKISSVLADYGFTTIKLYDDWKNADFIAQHKDQKIFLKVQLKSRFSIDKKYMNKDMYICFQVKDGVYLYPHDEAVQFVLNNSKVGETKSWKKEGIYNWPSLTKKYEDYLKSYKLKK